MLWLWLAGPQIRYGKVTLSCAPRCLPACSAVRCRAVWCSIGRVRCSNCAPLYTRLSCLLQEEVRRAAARPHTTLHYTSLHYTSLDYTKLYCTILHYTTAYYNTTTYYNTHFTIQYHNRPHHTTPHNSTPHHPLGTATTSGPQRGVCTSENILEQAGGS